MQKCFQICLARLRKAPCHVLFNRPSTSRSYDLRNKHLRTRIYHCLVRCLAHTTQGDALPSLAQLRCSEGRGQVLRPFLKLAFTRNYFQEPSVPRNRIPALGTLKPNSEPRQNNECNAASSFARIFQIENQRVPGNGSCPGHGRNFCVVLIYETDTSSHRPFQNI